MKQISLLRGKNGLYFALFIKSFFIICLVLILGRLMGYAWAHFQSQAACSTSINSTLNLDKNPTQAEIKIALARDGDNPAAYAKLGQAYLKRIKNQKQGVYYRSLLDQATSSYERAVRLNPVNSKYWYGLGRCYRKQRIKAGDTSKSWLKKADKAVQMSFVLRPNNPVTSFLTGAYWVWRSRLPAVKDKKSENGSFANLPSLSQVAELEKSLPGTHDQAIEHFQAIFRHTLTLPGGGRYWKKAAEIVYRYHKDKKVVQGIIPSGDDRVRKRINRYLQSNPVSQSSTEP